MRTIVIQVVRICRQEGLVWHRHSVLSFHYPDRHFPRLRKPRHSGFQGGLRSKPATRANPIAPGLGRMIPADVLQDSVKKRLLIIPYWPNFIGFLAEGGQADLEYRSHIFVW